MNFQKKQIVKTATTVFVSLFLLLFALTPTEAQTAQAEAQQVQRTDARATAGAYGPSPSYPYGRPNPAAPPELQQFDFMVGEFDCQEGTRWPDGSWNEFWAIWNARYFLNGHGIQDVYWNPMRSTSNLRIFDPKGGRWKVTYFQMPGYFSGVWEGKKEGDNMVVRRKIAPVEGKQRTSRLTFSNIHPGGYDWIGETVTEGDEENARAFWRSSCQRRR